MKKVNSAWSRKTLKSIFEAQKSGNPNYVKPTKKMVEMLYDMLRKADQERN